eukprot:TRINITY_DN29208_c0_g1_i1.p1 TRINITY_DN29208_c0_g1~~TRINITY_DN29208_c0_g1_i1.p1  ORF type:complete len:109 (-),score=35.49 TRINITY_DN29208_c0_g1_i1:115-441(-)
MMRRPPRSTQSRSSAASDVYKRQERGYLGESSHDVQLERELHALRMQMAQRRTVPPAVALAPNSVQANLNSNSKLALENALLKEKLKTTRLQNQLLEEKVQNQRMRND